MNERLIMRHLLWKDFRIVRPLIWSVLGMSVGVNALLLMLSSIGELNGRGLAEWSVAAWVVIPNLFLLGAPSLLVGSEEESGSNDWLRTLPIRWQAVWRSRFLVIFCVGSLLWCLALLQMLGLSYQWSSENGFINRVGLTGVLVTGFYSLLVFLVSLTCIYAIRAPLAAKGVFVVAYLLIGFGTAIGFTRFQDSLPERLAFGSLTLTALLILARWFAKRRMTAPISVRGSGSAPTLSHYQPPRLKPVTRPSPAASLLWQHVRQCGPVCVVLVGLSWIAAGFYWLTMTDPRDPMLAFLGGFAYFMVFVAASSLGALVLYGDNVRNRCGFFADRGIAPTQLWWTRLAVPAGACVALLIAAGFTADARARTGFDDTLVMFTLILVLFAYGQLVSQWVERPLLAFFAAPAYAAVTLSPLVFLIEKFNQPVYLIALVAPVLLLASWQLTQRWLEGGDRTRFTYRVVGYTAIAILLPCMVIVGGVGTRWVARMQDKPAIDATAQSALVSTNSIHVAWPTSERPES